MIREIINEFDLNKNEIEEIKEKLHKSNYETILALDLENWAKTYARLFRGCARDYINQKMKKENKNLEGKCRWKKVVANDESKREKGEGAITLSYDKPCYKCDGTKAYAEKINCEAYVV